MVLLWTVRATTAVRMPKEMINVTVQRKQGEPWGMVIVGGKDQALTVKLGRIKVTTIIISLFSILYRFVTQKLLFAGVQPR